MWISSYDLFALNYNRQWKDTDILEYHVSRYLTKKNSNQKSEIPSLFSH